MFVEYVLPRAKSDIFLILLINRNLVFIPRCHGLVGSLCESNQLFLHLHVVQLGKAIQVKIRAERHRDQTCEVVRLDPNTTFVVAQRQQSAVLRQLLDGLIC